MGLFDLLSKEAREKSALEKNARRVLNKHAQSADRFLAMEKLRDIGTDEALYALARRFSFRYDKTIEDEQEKEWVSDALVALGERAIAPLRRFMKEGDSFGYPLRILGKVATREQLLEIVDEVLAREEPGYTRDPSRKIQLLTWLGEWQGASDADVAVRVAPYLKDFDENVRFVAADVLGHHPDASSRDPLVEALLRPEEESRRIKMRIAEVLAAGGWPLGDRASEVKSLVERQLPELVVEGDRLKKRG